jgi:hypothetical protein
MENRFAQRGIGLLRIKRSADYHFNVMNMPTATVLTHQQQYQAVADRIRALAPAGAVGYRARFETGCFPTMEDHGRDFFSLGDFPTGVPVGKLDVLFLDSRLKLIGHTTTTVQFDPFDDDVESFPQEAKKVAQPRQPSQQPDLAGAVERGVGHLASIVLALLGIKPSKKAKSRRKQRGGKPRNMDSQTGQEPQMMPVESMSAKQTTQVEPPPSRPSPVETLRPSSAKTIETSKPTFDESAMPTVAPPEPPHQPQQASKTEQPNRPEQASKLESAYSSAQTSKPEQPNHPEQASKLEPNTIDEGRKLESANRPDQSDGRKPKQSAAHRAMPYTVAWNRIKRAVASLTDGEIMMFVANPQSGLPFLEFLAALCPGGILATD